MLYLYVLVSYSLTQTSTIQYFPTYSNCLVEKYKVAEKINNPSIKLDCITVEHKDI